MSLRLFFVIIKKWRFKNKKKVPEWFHWKLVGKNYKKKKYRAVINLCKGKKINVLCISHWIEIDYEGDRILGTKILTCWETVCWNVASQRRNRCRSRLYYDFHLVQFHLHFIGSTNNSLRHCISTVEHLFIITTLMAYGRVACFNWKNKQSVGHILPWIHVVETDDSIQNDKIVKYIFIYFF